MNNLNQYSIEAADRLAKSVNENTEKWQIVVEENLIVAIRKKYNDMQIFSGHLDTVKKKHKLMNKTRKGDVLLKVQPSDLELIPFEPMDREYDHPVSNEEAEGTADDTIQCAICWEMVCSLNRKSLPCSHVFHENCINKWLEISSNCPV
ncbi:hypothetical protein AVEN_213443-2, partial [Araneus ventricosus]